MKKDEVPQDKALFGEFHEVAYAVDESGRYVQTKSAGWDPKIVANSQFWKSLREEIRFVSDEVRQDRLSPIAYFMTLNQMDVALLASYTGIFKWRVKRHLKPAVFKKLKPSVLEKYAAVFKVPIDDLRTLPEDAENPESIRRWAELRD